MNNITSDRLCMLALIVIIVICVVQIYQMYFGVRTEHMNPALLTHQIEDLSSKPGDPVVINYYMKGDRFAADKKLNPKLEDPLITDPRFKCGPQMNWDTLALPGANNVYGDLIWHKTSPKMVLENNAMTCGNLNFNPPTGTPDPIASSCNSNYDLSQSLNEFGTIGALSDQYLINTPENLEKFINM